MKQLAKMVIFPPSTFERNHLIFCFGCYMGLSGGYFSHELASDSSTWTLTNNNQQSYYNELSMAPSKTSDAAIHTLPSTGLEVRVERISSYV